MWVGVAFYEDLFWFRWGGGGLGGWCVALCVLVGLGIEGLDGLEEKSKDIEYNRIEDG